MAFLLTASEKEAGSFKTFLPSALLMNSEDA